MWGCTSEPSVLTAGLHRAGLGSPGQDSFSGPAQFSYHEGNGWKIGVDEAAESQVLISVARRLIC